MASVSDSNKEPLGASRAPSESDSSSFYGSENKIRSNNNVKSDPNPRKPATPNLKNEFKFDGALTGSSKAEHRFSFAAGILSQTSGKEKYTKSFNAKELGLLYCEDMLLDNFSEWNHGRGSFCVSDSFHLFFQDYRLIVCCCQTSDSYLIDDDVYSVFVNYFEDVAVAVSQNIVHFISPNILREAQEEEEDEGSLVIRSINFEYEPRNTDLSITYSDMYSIFCISSGSFITLYLYHKARCECHQLDELDLSSCEYFKPKYFDLMKCVVEQPAPDDILEWLHKKPIVPLTDEEVELRKKAHEMKFAEESIKSVSSLLKNIPTVIKKLSFWIVEDSVHLFASGDENWISLCRVCAASETDEADNFNKICYISTDTTHTGCITAFSEPINESIFVSGDSKGSIAIWILKKGVEIESNRPEPVSTPFVTCFYKSLSEYPIISVLIVADARRHSIWVGDESGVVLGLGFNLQANKLSFIRKVVPSISSIPRQLFLFDHSSNALKRSVLRSVDSETGSVTDCVLYDLSQALFRAHPDSPPKGCGPWNLVDNCSVLPNLQLLFTYGSDKTMFVWDLASCHLINIIQMTDQLALSSVAIDRETPLDSIVDADTDIMIKLFVGHQRGCIHEYDLTLRYEDVMKQDEVENTTNDSLAGGDNSKLINPSSNGGGFDLLLHLEGGIQADLQSIEMQSLGSNLNMFDDATLTNTRTKDAGYDENTLPKSQLKLRFQRLDKGKCLDLCALPVTDLHASKGGAFLTVCFAKRILMVYSFDKSTVIRKVDFDSPIADVSRVIFTDHLRSRNDLCLVLQDAQTTTIYDAITGKKLTQFQLDLFGMDIYYSMLWELSVVNNRDNDKSSTGNRSLAGICVTKGLGIFLFSESTGCSRLLVPECSSPDYDSPLNSLVLGCESFEVGESPMVCIWTLRRLLVLRINLGLDGSEFMCMKMVDFTVPDRYVRIIRAKALYTDKILRNHRVLIVLSDGSTSILNI